MIKKIRIGDKLVGGDQPTFIIAEAGSNHDQKLSQAKKLIAVAADSGADAIKFQLFKAEVLYSAKDPEFDVVKKNEFPREWLKELVAYAKKKRIIFLATPFDKEAIDLLVKLEIPAIKWGSSEAVSLPLLRHAALKKKPILLSTGMCDLADVYEAVEVIRQAGNEDIVLLQCTSLYPAKPQDVNLRVMDTLRDTFHLPVGFSDHTLGLVFSLAAVARGAWVIEKHFTLNRRLPGTDHSYALEPKELKKMITNIRQVEQSLGSPDKKMLPEERKVGRRTSVIAVVNIAKGSLLTEDMVVIKKPGLGIRPRFLKTIFGRKVKKSIKKGEPIVWQMVD